MKICKFIITPLYYKDEMNGLTIEVEDDSSLSACNSTNSVFDADHITIFANSEKQ